MFFKAKISLDTSELELAPKLFVAIHVIVLDKQCNDECSCSFQYEYGQFKNRNV